MEINKSLYLFVLIVMSIFFTACDKDKKEVDTTTTKITSFALHNDSVEGLDKVRFTIDNDSNIIYNADSADYGITVDSVFPLIGWSYLSSVIINDTIDYSQQDTVWLDFTKPVKIHTVSSDKKHTRDYIVKVKVHKVNPEEYIWQGLKTEIYRENPIGEKAVIFRDSIYLFVKTSETFKCYKSQNAADWNGYPVNGLDNNIDPSNIYEGNRAIYTANSQTLLFTEDGIKWQQKNIGIEIIKILFCMNDNIYIIGKTNGKESIMSALETELVFNTIADIPSGFPISDTGTCIAEAPSGKMRAFIVGGYDKEGKMLNSIWSTENGSYWSNLTIGRDWFTPRVGVAIIQYADGIVLFGGRDENGICEDFQLYSPDYGLTWGEPIEEAKISTLYPHRYNISAMTRKDGYVFLIGGQTNENTYVKDAWSGLRYASLPGFEI